MVETLFEILTFVRFTQDEKAKVQFREQCIPATVRAFLGSPVYVAKQEVQKFCQKIIQQMEEAAIRKKENLSLTYETDLDVEYYNEEECFAALLDDNAEKDRLYGTTRKGPHRDDIKISADGIDLRRYGSQGQQRTAALSLKLSEIKLIEEETGESPILLLDDVLSELDNERQKYLINSLGDNQMFITTTDLIGSVARELPSGKIFKIKAGDIDIEI